MAKTFAALAATGLAAFIGGAFVLTQLHAPADRFEACRATSVAGGDIGGAFTLVDHNGKTVTDQDVITGPTLIYFGYTYCPDFCPMDTERNAIAVEILDERGVEVHPVFVTIDPERDTPELLAEYAQSFHPRMTGLTGSLEQVAAASRAYKTYYKKQDSDDDEFYLVDHSTFSYLVFPEEGFVELFRRDTAPDALADQIACFVDKA